jgi:hypothetical protein
MVMTMSPERLELARRCGELAGVLHEETGLQVSVVLGFGGVGRVVWVEERPHWLQGWSFSDEQILSVEPREIADRISSEVKSSLRSPRPEDRKHQENRQHHDDDGVGALASHIHEELTFDFGPDDPYILLR